MLPFSLNKFYLHNIYFPYVFIGDRLIPHLDFIRLNKPTSLVFLIK